MVQSNPEAIQLHQQTKWTAPNERERRRKEKNQQHTRNSQQMKQTDDWSQYKMCVFHIFLQMSSLRAYAKALPIDRLRNMQKCVYYSTIIQFQ